MSHRTFTRRSALKGLGFAAAASATPRFLSAMALKPSPIRLGIASYTFREFKQPQQLVDFMHQLNLKNINLKDVHLPMGPLDEVKKNADWYRSQGLVITGGGTIYFQKDEDEDIKAKFDYAKAAGFPIIIGSPSHAALERVASFVKKYDIKLAIHNHGPEDKEWPSPQDILAKIGNLDKRVGFCVDVGHTMRAGKDVPETIKEVGSRLYCIHMKDLAEKDKKESQVAVGEGIMPVKQIFETLVKIKYPGCVDLEYEINGKDPMPGVTKSIATERKVLEEMGYSA